MTDVDIYVKRSKVQIRQKISACSLCFSEKEITPVSSIFKVITNPKRMQQTWLTIRNKR